MSAREEFEKWQDSLPRCPESCDGDLVGTEHDENCPVGQAGGFATHFDAFKVGRAGAPIRTALQELLDWLEDDTLAIMRGSVSGGLTFDHEDCALLRDRIDRARVALDDTAADPVLDGLARKEAAERAAREEE